MDACFSGASLAIVGALMTALTGTIGVLWKLSERLHEQYIAAMQARLDREMQRHAEERAEDRQREEEWKATALRWEELYRSQQTVTRQAIGLAQVP